MPSRMKQITIRAKERTIAEIDRLASQHDDSPSDTFREALERGLPLVALFKGADAAGMYGPYTAHDLQAALLTSAAVINDFLARSGHLVAPPSIAPRVPTTSPRPSGQPGSPSALPGPEADPHTHDTLLGLGIDLDGFL